MTAVVLACLWVLLSAVAAALPSRFHWRAAYVLGALFVPLLIFVALEAGWPWALGYALAAASVLRWPLIYFARWCRVKLHGKRSL